MELVLVKHEWGLSMAAWLYRLHDVGRIDASTFRALWKTFRANGWSKTEPGPALPRETGTVWQQRLASLIVNRRISHAMGAQAMGVEEEMLGGLLSLE